MVKVITLKQPWAHLVVCGYKLIETRAWSTTHRGELYIHASKVVDFGNLSLLNYEPFSDFIKSPTELTHGAIIGKVELYGIEEMNDKLFMASVSKQERAFGNYDPDRFAWLLRNPVRFQSPIPAIGKLSIWEFPFDGFCNHCGTPSDRLTTQSAKNVDGVMVQLLQPGERLCQKCANARGHESLSEINKRIMKEVSHG